MNTIEDESGTVTLETVNSVTLTQDTDGNIILHCPQNADAEELGSDECLDPAHKRLRLSTEDDTSRISVVTLPISENDDSFEVTMTATTEMTENEIGEGAVAQIQIIQNDGSLSPNTTDDVSPVSQAWFTTKEDKDSLVNKGHKWKQGMWSKEEIDILMSNIDCYLKNRGIQDPTEIIFEMSKDERKDFYRSIAWGLNRPLFAVYRRVLRMYDNRNHVGKYTPEEIDKLKELREKHGNDWATIGAALGRSASSVKDRCRLMKDTCNTGKWTEEEERRLAEVVHELTGTEPGHTVTQGVSWASVAELVGTRSEKQCRSKWLNYLNWKQSGGTEWTKEDDNNLIKRIAELGVDDENDINWDIMAGGWSSVRSPQWLRSKWWTIKRQVTNHKDLAFSVLLKGLQDLMENQLPDNKFGVGPRTGCSSPSTVQQVQIRVARLEETSSASQNPMTALQIPVQITHVSANDSSTAATDTDSITLNSGTLQTFEILPSFHLQPTGTPGTYFIQTGSNQGLPLTLSTSPTVTLTAAASPSSPDQIIVHTLSPDNLLNSSDNVTVQMSHPSVIIRAVASDDIGSPGTQTDLTVDHPDLTDPQQTLEVDSFSSDIHQDKLDEDQDSPPTDLGNGSELRHVNQRKFLYSTTAEPETCLGQEEKVQTELTGTYTDEALGSPTMEEQVGESTIAEGTVLIVPSTDGFMQTTDLDNDSVLPLTTLTDPILEHQGEVLDINSSLDSPNPEDSKDIEGFVDCR
ncbi:cyclin-D-binding Myb-like transcription factor 1 isoform X1 [Acipenser ruthenus]|uniref:cyclin-D-binding Myb-like transcription factor 1 isoform X1 n=1 Tax=Acipenser ruthenus TaxID=7906 RepID=UPI0027403D11|nr:cyclin-D-binding Myb-like transcription factor 1 isoform X1 [Acipenser ruthenus]